MNKEGLSDSLEDYLEVVAELQRSQKVARVKDVAARLGVRTPSATHALQTLGERGYVDYKKNAFVTLTAKGMHAAGCLTAKHRVFQKLLQDVLQIPEAQSESIAGRVEHALDCRTNRRLIRLLDYFERQGTGDTPISRDQWLAFIRSEADGEIPDVCSEWCDLSYQRSQLERR